MNGVATQSGRGAARGSVPLVIVFRRTRSACEKFAQVAKTFKDTRSRRRLQLRSNLFLKTEDLAVLSSEAIHHLRLLLFHVDDLFPLRIFVGWCPGDEG